MHHATDVLVASVLTDGELAVPVDVVRERLGEAIGEPPSVQDLLRGLRRSPDFVVVEPPKPWADTSLWPDGTAEAYAGVVRRLGPRSTPLIMHRLADYEDRGPLLDLVHRLRASLLAVWDAHGTTDPGGAGGASDDLAGAVRAAHATVRALGELDAPTS